MLHFSSRTAFVPLILKMSIKLAHTYPYLHKHHTLWYSLCFFAWYKRETLKTDSHTQTALVSFWFKWKLLFVEERVCLFHFLVVCVRFVCVFYFVSFIQCTETQLNLKQRRWRRRRFCYCCCCCYFHNSNRLNGYWSKWSQKVGKKLTARKSQLIKFCVLLCRVDDVYSHLKSSI